MTKDKSKIKSKKNKSKKKTRKTKTHLTEAIITNVISLLIEGLSLRQVVIRLKLNDINISHETVRIIRDNNMTHIDNIKKRNREIQLETDNEKYKKVVSGFLDVSRRAVAHITDKKLKQSTGVALSTIAGISYDKHNLATGGATERVEVKFKDKSSMLDYIKGKKK